MRRSRKLLLALFALLLPLQAQAVLEIKITGGTEGALPVAVVPFAWEGAGAELPVAVGGVVADDLRRSGRFDPLPEGEMLARPHTAQAVNYQNWRALGTEHLVVGKARPMGPDAYNVQFQLLDVFRQAQLTGHSLTVRKGELRSAAHRIADIVYETILGERGAFDTRIAYVTERRPSKDERRFMLQVADTDGHNPHTILESKQPLMSPAWSPDTRSLAYVSFENDQAEIYVQELATGHRRKLAAFDGLNGAPAWSPDGRHLALTLSKDGNPEIYLLEVDTGNLRRLTSNRAIDTEPAWLPDGRGLVFTSDRSGSPQIYRLSLTGDRPRRITFEGSYNAGADVSPDGEHVAMVHGQGGRYRVAVMNLETGALRVLTDGRLDESPSFAPNGSMILYAAEAGGQSVLSAVSVEGRARQRLSLQAGDVRDPAWSPFRN